MKRFGRIDAVVCHTAHPPKGDLLAIDDEAWHQGLDMLILNVVRLTRSITPIMEKQGGKGNQIEFNSVQPCRIFELAERNSTKSIGSIQLSK